MGKTHTLVGVLSLVTFSVCTSQTLTMGVNTITPIIGVVTATIGSLAPDVDIEGSTASKKVPLLSKVLTHRGITHTLVMPLVMYALLTSVSLNTFVASLVFGLLFGWVMHIATDLLNRKGVPLFWPIITQKVHIACIKTGTFQETLFSILFTVGCLAIIVVYGGLL